MLLITSIHVIYPWILLRRVAVVRSERLTERAIRIWFSPREKIRPLYGLAIADTPLGEWHAFAAIPPLDDGDEGSTSCIIANAGDWTVKLNESPAPHYYMRGRR